MNPQPRSTGDSRAPSKRARVRLFAALSAAVVFLAAFATLLPAQAQTPSDDATLSALTIEDAILGGTSIPLSPRFNSATTAYTVSVGNRIDAVALTATKNDTDATVVITSDDDTSTEGVAELNLNVGANTLTVTVTAEDGSTVLVYTITVTRAAAPPAPTDCPTDTDWCATLGVGYWTSSAATFKLDDWGYSTFVSNGDLSLTTFSYDGDSYTITGVVSSRITGLPGNTITFDSLNIYSSAELPDGTVLQVGSRVFNVDAVSRTTTLGHKQWDVKANPLNWTEGQHVTVSLRLPSTDATLSALELDAASGGAFTLIPEFDPATTTYEAAVFNRSDVVALTATKNDAGATVVITSDDDTSTEGEAELNLSVGPNTLTVTVTAEDGSTVLVYTIMVTRTAAPPTPTDCPTVAHWCATMVVGYFSQTVPAAFKLETWGYNSAGSDGDLGLTMFSHDGDSYTISRVERLRLTDLPGNTIGSDEFRILSSPELPDGTILQMGSRTFTVDTDSDSSTNGEELWDASAIPLWAFRQNVTVSLKIPSTDATLSALAVNDGTSDLTLGTPFASGTYFYSAAVGNSIDEVTLDATTNDVNSEITDVTLNGTAVADSDFSDGITVPSLAEGNNVIVVTVTAGDSSTQLYTISVRRQRSLPSGVVPANWSLKHNSIGPGDRFRLLFLSSTKRDGTSSTIADYNTFVQTAAAAGHTDIQAYSSGFRAVVCTEAVDARDNTNTTGTGSLNIYWLGGQKLADNYADFYDGDWDKEGNSQDRNELGVNGPNTNQEANFPLTGCDHDGTEDFIAASPCGARQQRSHHSLPRRPAQLLRLRSRPP